MDSGRPINPYASPSAASEAATPCESEAALPFIHPRWWHAEILFGCFVIEVARLEWTTRSVGLGSYFAMMSPLAVAFQLTRAILAAIAMASVVVMSVQWFRRRPFPQQPGEWILVAAGVVHWIAVVVTLAGGMIRTASITGVTLNAIPLLVQAAILALGGTIAGSGRAWAVALSSWSVAIVMSMLMSLRMIGRESNVPTWLQYTSVIFFAATVAIGSIAIIVAVVNDVRRKEPRGWIHATAIGWVCAQIVLDVLLQITQL